MEIDGQKELKSAFKELDMAVRKRIMRAALKKAGDPIAREAEQNVKPLSPTIAGSIGVQMKSYRAGSFQALKIGPTTDPLTFRTRERYSVVAGKYLKVVHKPFKTAHLVEGGTKPHRIPFKKGSRKGRVWNHPGVAARPWLKPARDEHEELAKQVFFSTSWSLIEREAKRLARKQAKAAKLSPQTSDPALAEKAAKTAKALGFRNGG